MTSPDSAPAGYHDGSARQTARRGPRTDTSSPELRARLQDTALDIAAAEGYNAASLRRISAALGMRTATVYSFFPGGKEELVTSALVRVMENFWEKVGRTQHPGSSPLDNLRRALDAHLSDTLERPLLNQAWEVILASDRTTPFMTPQGRARIEELRNAYVALLAELLRQLGATAFDARCWAGVIAALCNDPAWYQEARAHVQRQGGGGDRDGQEVLGIHEYTWLMVSRLLRPQTTLTD